MYFKGMKLYLQHLNKPELKVNILSLEEKNIVELEFRGKLQKALCLLLGS